MLYSSDDTHIKNRNDTRATPRQAPTKTEKNSLPRLGKFFF